MRPCSLILADDHPLVLRGLSEFIGEQPDFSIVAMVSNGVDALRRIEEHEPDIAVLDLVMQRGNGLDVLRSVVCSDIRTRVVFLSAMITDAQVLDAIAAGVYGILRKESAPEMLLDCLRDVSAGRKWLPADLLEGALTRIVDQSPALRQRSILTDRELQIALLVSRGFSNKMVARQLGLSEGTVKIHVHNIFRKLRVDNRTALSVVASTWVHDD